MSYGDVERIKQYQKEVGRFLGEYLEVNRQNLDEFLPKRQSNGTQRKQTYRCG